MNAELQRVWKEALVGFLRYNPGMYLKQLEKNRKHFRHDSQLSHWEAIQASPEHNSTAYRLQQGPKWLSRCTDSFRLDSLGVESWWGEIFHTNPGRSQDPHSLLYNGYRVFLPGVKRPRRGVDHQPPSRAEVKENLYLYLYSPSVPWWPVLGWGFTRYSNSFSGIAWDMIR